MKIVSGKKKKKKKIVSGKICRRAIDPDLIHYCVVKSCFVKTHDLTKALSGLSKEHMLLILIFIMN